MNSIDLIYMGIKNLWRRKLRTFLTVLGVIIGASSIIVMLSIGFGLSQAFEDQLSQWGSLTTINVYPKWSDPSMPTTGNTQVYLNDEAVTSFKSISHVVAVNPIVETYGTVIDGKYISNLPIRGIDPSIMEDFGFKIADGRLLEESDEMTAVLGGQVAMSFYDPKARVWREPKVDLMKDKLVITLNPTYG